MALIGKWLLLLAGKLEKLSAWAAGVSPKKMGDMPPEAEKLLTR